VTVIFYLAGHKKGLCYKKCKPNKLIRWSDSVGFDAIYVQQRGGETMQLPVGYLLLRMGIAQQSLIAVRNEIMQVCAQMPVDGTNVVALEQILAMCETTLAGLDRTYVRITAWNQIYPNHTGMLTSDHLKFADDNWVPINDDDDDVLNLSDDMLNLSDDDDDDDDDNDDDSLDLNDDDFYRDPEEKQREYTQDECDGYLLPLSFAQDNLPVTNNSLTDHEFALLFGLVQPLPLDVTEPVVPLMFDIFGNPLQLLSDSPTQSMMFDIFGNLLQLPSDSPTQPNADASSDPSYNPDPDYNVPGSL
jgi:hypothetical protein